MPVKPRGRKWQAEVNYQGRRARRCFDSARDAEVWEAQARADLVAGRDPQTSETAEVRGKPQTLDALFKYVRDRVWADKKSSRVLIANGQEVVNILGPNTKVSSIDKLAADRLIDVLSAKGNTNATINRKIAALTKMLSEARNLGCESQRFTVPRLTEPKGRIRWYTREEEERILNYLNHIGEPQWALFFQFLADTGLRLGEAKKFQWEDIHKNKIVLLDSKSGKGRTVPMTGRAQAAVDVQSRSLKGPWAWVEEHRLRWIWGAVRVHMKWEKDEQAVVHAFRHTFVSRMVQAGVPLAVVQKLAGHEVIQTTMRYAHLAPENLDSAIAVLEVN